MPVICGYDITLVHKYVVYFEDVAIIRHLFFRNDKKQEQRFSMICIHLAAKTPYVKLLSIKDIARLAGVVPSTVSFVINGKEKEMRISDDMVKKIRKIIKDTGYVPNRSAASLRTGRTHVIGLIVEDISNTFFAHMAKCVEDFACQAGYRVVYCSTENNAAKGTELIRMLYKQVDGFIITPASGMRDEVLKLMKNKKPVVLLDRYFPDIKIPGVLVNNRTGVYNGVDLLVANEYRNIAFIINSLEHSHMTERLNAFVERTRHHSLYDNSLVLKLPFSSQEGAYENEIRKFLQKKTKIDALFFATNYLCLQGLKVLQELRWPVPDRVGVLCFDDHEIFKLYTPSITALNQPVSEIAQTCVRILKENMDNRKPETYKEPILLDTELIVRDSV